jgi:hypothetical protein
MAAPVAGTPRAKAARMAPRCPVHKALSGVCGQELQLVPCGRAGCAVCGATGERRLAAELWVRGIDGCQFSGLLNEINGSAKLSTASAKGFETLRDRGEMRRGPGVLVSTGPCGAGGDDAHDGAERRKTRRAHVWLRVRGGCRLAVSRMVG